ncbi:Uncharacterised protein [Sebaldella termitidis]|uniref:Uncharacterized protein n=1 Tax=Sebaldella termitidis (strain ATCC 33386 / NCTC 11300) TaxID=526218 RepID=D1AGA6_SEBTE|nr:hypothetical protein [Sebaldella termitidis]ACZ10732.1 hypothetical protein Sterm_3898 [Sebaldella termitidis ATCC 33386]SUI26073.1 Uncharacterised protein [Sebaldella termitidis]
MLEILKKRIEEVSGKNCISGFAADFPYAMLTGNNIIIQPESQESRTIGLNHRKEITRRVKLIYGRFNKLKTGSLEEVEWVEEFLSNLEKDRELLTHIINMDHQYIVGIEKNGENDKTGYVVFQIYLDIKER